jgi:hypothetical protein
MLFFKKNKGQSALIGMMIFIMIFISLVAMIPVLKPLFNMARDNNHLDCTNTSISTAEKATCIIVDWGFLYFVGVSLFAAGAYITGRKLGYF